MAITIKSQREIELMTRAGEVLAIVHEELGKFIRPGLSTLDIDKKGEEIIRSFDGCTPSFLHYNGYPASICVSVNEAVVHGIPRDYYYIKEGDIVSLDAGVCYKGYHSDAARTWPVGEVSDEAKRLMKVTEECFFEGIRYAEAGRLLNEISKAIEAKAVENGFSIIRDYIGHGIGSTVHEAPEIPNFARIARGQRLTPGMTLAIEPMLSAGDYRVARLADNWTAVTVDGSLTSHYENTILITEGKPVILSLKS